MRPFFNLVFQANLTINCNALHRNRKNLHVGFGCLSPALVFSSNWRSKAAKAPSYKFHELTNYSWDIVNKIISLRYYLKFRNLWILELV